MIVAMVCANLPMPGIGVREVFGETEDVSGDFTIVEGVLEKYNGDGGNVVIPDGGQVSG